MRAIRINDPNGSIVAGGFGRVDNGIVEHAEKPRLYDYLLKHANDTDFKAVYFVDAAEAKRVKAEIAAAEKAKADARAAAAKKLADEKRAAEKTAGGSDTGVGE